jgi:hypothetical protein
VEPRITCAVLQVMRMSNLICCAAAAVIPIALIACTDPAEPPPDPEAAAQVGEAQPLPSTLPPPSATTPRYVGLWATTAEGCAEPAWRFEANRVSTRGEVSCEFQNVTMTNNGYDIQASCTAESPPTPSSIQLSFAESARAMMIAGGPWQAGTALVYCGGLPSP